MLEDEYVTEAWLCGRCLRSMDKDSVRYKRPWRDDAGGEGIEFLCASCADIYSEGYWNGKQAADREVSLRRVAEDAIKEVERWGELAGPKFQQLHDLDGVVRRLTNALGSRTAADFEYDTCGALAKRLQPVKSQAAIDALDRTREMFAEDEPEKPQPAPRETVEEEVMDETREAKCHGCREVLQPRNHLKLCWQCGTSGGLWNVVDAAIRLKVPRSTISLLDAMIRESRRWDAAVAAMQGLLANSEQIDLDPEEIARAAHKQVDALLAEANKGIRHTEVKGQVTTPQMCQDLLGLADVSVTEADCEAWSEQEREQACDWAAAIVAVASDNDGVTIPDKPQHVPLTDTEIRLEADKGADDGEG